MMDFTRGKGLVITITLIALTVVFTVAAFVVLAGS